MRDYRIEYRRYESSVDPALRLFANFAIPSRPAPLVVTTHGWHQTIMKGKLSYVLLEMLLGKVFLVEVNMRGRGECTGEPDANGRELQDVIDAAEFARDAYADMIRGEPTYLYGSSGGGGNAYGLLGKFPDYFAAAFVECGITDYAAWYESDEVGQFRDEMDVWLGGSPREFGRTYASRSGITTVHNLQTPLMIVHGDQDADVPIEQSRRYARKACELGNDVTFIELPGVPHYIDGDADLATANRDRLLLHFSRYTRCPSLPRQGALVVTGYLKTKEFELELGNVGQVAELRYDLEQGIFCLRGPDATEGCLSYRHSEHQLEAGRQIAVGKSRLGSGG